MQQSGQKSEKQTSAKDLMSHHSLILSTLLFHPQVGDVRVSFSYAGLSSDDPDLGPAHVVIFPRADPSRDSLGPNTLGFVLIAVPHSFAQALSLFLGSFRGLCSPQPLLDPRLGATVPSGTNPIVAAPSPSHSTWSWFCTVHVVRTLHQGLT